MNIYYCFLVVYKSNPTAHTSDLAMPSATSQVSSLLGSLNLY